MVLFQAALIQTEGDSLLCGGITLMTHFKEQKPYTETQEVSRNLKFVTNNTTNVYNFLSIITFNGFFRDRV